MTEHRFRVRFWGTRGSYPTPGPGTVRFGGNTCCVEVNAGGHTLIFDAGTGIIELGHDLLRRAQQQGGRAVEASLYLTHMHHDHTQGFPFFSPLYRGTSKIYVLGPRAFEKRLEESLHYAVMPPSFPVSLHETSALKQVYTLTEAIAIVYYPGDSRPHIYNQFHDPITYTPDMVRVRLLKSFAHPREGVYIYRVEWNHHAMVFATDVEGYIGVDKRLTDFAANADLLIHDSQYSQQDYVAFKQGWGHSTPQIATDLAKRCNAKQLVLFHHEPRYDDARVAALEHEAQGLFSDTLAAYEGLEIELCGDASINE